MKTHEEWIVGIMFAHNEKEGTYSNALYHYPGSKIGDRYCKSHEEAQRVLEYVYRKFNSVKTYNAKGERYETRTEGHIGVTLVSRKEDDNRMRIVKHYIKKRTVTEWEIVERNV